MAPAGRQGHPKATIGTPKGDIVDHNRTTPSMKEDRICYLKWVMLLLKAGSCTLQFGLRSDI